MTVFDIEALVLFYLHLALILWYPRPPIQGCVGAVVCAVEEIEISTLSGGQGVKMCARKSNFTAKCLRLLSLIVVRNFQGLTRRFCFFSFPFYFFAILELPRIVIQPVYHGDGHYRGLSVRQTSSLLETGRSDICGGKVVPPNIFIHSMAWSVLGAIINRVVPPQNFQLRTSSYTASLLPSVARYNLVSKAFVRFRRGL